MLSVADRRPDSYDVFISHSPDDREWVDDRLLPRLEQAGWRVAVDYRDFIVGMPRLENIERAVSASRFTIVVLTSTWLTSEWNEFEASVTRALDPNARCRRLMPVLLQPCELPSFVTSLKLDVADLTAERYKEKQLKRLIQSIEDKIPVPLPPFRDPPAWLKWLHHYRRQARLGIAAAVILWLIVALTAHAFPFRWLFAWQEVAAPLPANGWTLHSTGQTLLVGAENSREGCARKEQGIWYMPLIGDRFLPSQISASLCVEDWKTKSPSIVAAFASHPRQPETIYALTSHSGILVSTDGGVHFDEFAPPSPPAAEAQGARLLGVEFQEPPVLWVAGFRDGLWRYRADGWIRMDGSGAGSCNGLPFVEVTALLVTEEHVLIGTDRKGLWLTSDGGLICRAVFDSGPRSQYDFKSLAVVTSGAVGRYLALVYDTQVDGRTYLLDLCSRPGICTDEMWRGELLAWRTSTNAVQLLTQDDGAGDIRWYVVARPFHLFYGEVGDPDHWQTSLFLPHPALTTEVALAPADSGQIPYLMVANRVYRYRPGE
jgi:hypothetical protein